MNKVFRIVWSHATQSWVVVSELTKAHKKQSSYNAQKSAVNFSGRIFKSSVVALGLLSGSNAAYAVNSVGVGQDTAVAWGTGSSANGENAVAIGNKARSNVQDGISIGDTAINGGSATGSIAIGKNAVNGQKESIALGVSALNQGNNSIAIGNTAATKDGSEAVVLVATRWQNNNLLP